MPASIGVNLRVTGHCSQGGRKYMEDLFSVAYQQTEDERDLEYAFFGIYDGHGGSEAAAFAKEHLMDSIVKQRQFWSDNDDDVLKAIRNGYMLTHLNMWKELEKWPKTVTGLPSTAGTTASVAFIRRGKIYIGHVGDSAIVLGYQKEGSTEWAAKPLTLDHKPESTAEMDRIHQSGGKVVSKAGVPRVVWNRPRLGHKGPIKKTTPIDEIPFLAVARSLGDLWSYNIHNDEFIVSPDPDVGVLSIDPSKFRCLIFGTDGLWNMISSEGAVSLVQATEQHNEAAVVAGAAGGGTQPRDWLNPSKSLVDHALERWSNTRMRADNTSVVTLMLDPPGPPRAAVLRSRTAAQRPVATPTPSASSSQPLHHTPTSDKSAPEENTKSEVPSESDGRRVPQNGLTIMTRYTEGERPAASAEASERTPLPPCATLDGRFSAASPDDASADVEEVDPGDAVNNYGNPLESYFIARLLNRNHIVNTLCDVYEEIVNGQSSSLLDADKTSPSPQTVLSDNDQKKEESVEAVSNQTALENSAESSTDALLALSEENNSLAHHNDSTEDVESIQINEVSSSSPTECPKPRGRKPKSDAKHDVTPVATSGRTLRSHDVEIPHRPQTRQTAHKGRAPNAPQTPVLERVVILSRARGVPIAPAIMRIERATNNNEVRPPARKSTVGEQKPLTVTTEGRNKRDNAIRATRSRENVIPITQKVTRGIGSVAKELRGERIGNTQPNATPVQIMRAGNAARAPGHSRRSTPAARPDRSETPEARPEHSKENFAERGVGRRRLRGLRCRDGRVAPLPPAVRPRTRLLDNGDLGSVSQSALPGTTVARSPTRQRRCRPEDSDAPEVHSTTGEHLQQRSACSIAAKDAPAVKPRALRSRNDAESIVTGHRKEIMPMKRPLRSIDDELTHTSKTPKLSYVSERCTRALGKRASGPWAPALALRNRLRKRLTK